jgi:mannose-1-phosphate guanylyltransferase
LQRDPEARVVVTPADHAIDNEELFAETIRKAFGYIAENDVLMTLGVVPTRPDTNYGYVQAIGGKEAYKSDEPMQVKTFTEKPDKDMATLFISTGEFFWNAGIFLWKASTIKSEMERHLPEVTGLFNGWEMALGSKIEGEFIARAFTDCPNISVDYGVMEKAENVYVHSGDFGWSDVGTWGSVYQHSRKDKYANVKPDDRCYTYNTRSSIISIPKDKVAIINGLRDYIVVDTEDVLLICPRNEEQNIKKYIDEVKYNTGDKHI